MNNDRLPLYLCAVRLKKTLKPVAAKWRFVIALLRTTDHGQQSILLLNHQIPKVRKIHGVDDFADIDIVFPGIGMVLPVKRYESRVIV